MSAIWSDGAKLQRWLDVELAALDGWAETGGVPRATVEAMAGYVHEQGLASRVVSIDELFAPEVLDT